MSGTIVRIISEAGIPITFITDAGLQPTLTNVKGLACSGGATSSTVIAGLLQVACTRPVSSQDDVRLPMVILDSRDRVVKWTCGEGEDVAIERLGPRTPIS
jgi:hypothetical protein